MKNIDQLHKRTCERKETGYTDPNTGFFVLSAHYLKSRGHCCGAGCRHCPYSPAEQKAAGRPTIKKGN